MSREQDFITEARTATRALWNALNTLETLQKEWNALNTLETLQKEWNALDYGSTLDVGEGENAGITAAAVGAVVFDTANALRTVMNQGFATNAAKLL